ncbi:MAG: prepilin-type N-terminal cleavage/methylation domain-containing protein [Coriobacteriia bacterium]|nr:prepilin-type N-terminal cleavage/methylation domain-containing protein [Coriobacteriia bacterium]
MQAFRKNDEGFTLVELMVVVLIIGILVAIAIPVFNNASNNARIKSCQANMRTIEGAYQTYMANNGTAITAATTVVSGGILVPGFIAAVPACPSDPNFGTTTAKTPYSLATTGLTACPIVPLTHIHY